MKVVLLVAPLIPCCLSLHGQISASLNPLRDGSTEIRITNDATVSLIAFALRAYDRKGVFDKPLVVYVDTEIDPSTLTLSPGEERPIREARRFVTRDGKHMYASFEVPIVTAGIFSDGTTIGDATLLNGLVLRRRNMLQAVEVASELLADAGRHNVSRSQIIGLFRRMSDAAGRWYLPPEQQVGRTVYQSLVERLTNLPPAQLGSPFPPSAFVAQETALLNQQRVALLESQPSLADVGSKNTP